jgi:peptidoglycan/LPS O-acetylase OafA/YrhL
MTRTTATEAPPTLGPAGPAAEKPDYRPALDGLRALAVAAVIAYHLGYAHGGFLGVDLFFVLSGYLITGLLVSEFARTAQISILRFWARRVRRLYPALVPVIIAVLIYAAGMPDVVTRSSLRGDAISCLFYFANWHFAAGAQSYFAQFSAPSPLRHFWSLAIEEQFYLAWPIVAAACMWLGRRRTWLLAAAAAVGTVASAIGLAALWNPSDPSTAYYSTFARVHELLIGALLALLLRRRAGAASSPWSTTALAGGAAAAIVVAFAFASDVGAGYYDGGSVLFCLLVAALIAGVERRGPNPVREVFSLGPVRYVGRISYALYLWHWPVIVWATPTRIGLDGLALNLFRLALMVALAAASTHLLEEPIRRGRVGRSLTPRRLAWVLPAVSVAMLAMTFGLTRGGRSPASAAVTAAATHRGGAARPPPARSRVAESRSGPTLHDAVVAVFGDSVPEELRPWLRAAALRAGASRLVDAAIPGCGVVSMTQTDAAGNVVSWQPTCDAIAADERDVMARQKPDAVIWFSGTENEPMLVGGTPYPPGSPEHRRALRRAMIAAHQRLTVDGAHLYLVEVPPHAPPPGGCASADANPQCSVNATFNSTVPYVNAQLRWLARRFDDTSLISLDGVICPGGAPCPATIDGVAVRPDGTHYSDTFAPRVARTVLAAAEGRGR